MIPRNLNQFGYSNDSSVHWYYLQISFLLTFKTLCRFHALRSVVLFYVTLRYVVLCYVSYHVTLCYFKLCYTSSYVILCYFRLRSVMLYFAILYIMLHYVTLC